MVTSLVTHWKEAGRWRCSHMGPLHNQAVLKTMSPLQLLSKHMCDSHGHHGVVMNSHIAMALGSHNGTVLIIMI